MDQSLKLKLSLVSSMLHMSDAEPENGDRAPTELQGPDTFYTSPRPYGSDVGRIYRAESPLEDYASCRQPMSFALQDIPESPRGADN